MKKVDPTGIEPVSQPRQGCILADGRWVLVI